MTTDIREAVRSFTSQPGFSLVVILTLALAIGVNSAIFSVLNGVLLRPLDYADPGRLVVVWESNAAAGQPQSETSGATYLDWRARARTFSSLGAFRARGFTLTTNGNSEHIASVETSPALFRVLGVSPLVGRVFTEEEEQPGHEKLAILSYGAWRRRFGGRADIAGQPIVLDGQTFEVIGVMPRTFQFPAGDRDVDAWSPLTLDVRSLLTRPHRMYRTIGRLAPGATIAQAQGEMDGIAADLAREHPEANAGWGVRLVPAHEQVVGDIGGTLWVLFGAVVLVLLIACANIANLLLARSARVAKDFSIRAALGAGRGVLVRRSLVESGLLAASGALAGLGVAWAGVRVLRRLIPPTVPRADQIGLDLPVLAFTAAIAVASGLLFGLVPAWRAMSPDLTNMLQETGRGFTAGRRTRRLSDVMVVAEVALALMLLVGAGLLIRSFVNLTSVSPGFRTSRVVSLEVVLPETRYATGASKREFYSALLDSVRALPGVTHAGAVSALPLSPLGTQFDIPFTIDGLEATSPSDRPRAAYRAVMAGYFEAMAIPLRKGRLFDTFDGRDRGPRVAIINETVAKRYFPGSDPLNRQVKMPMAGDLTIVGVVGDVKHDGLQLAAKPEVFVPYYQLALSEMQLVIESDDDAVVVASGVKRAIGRLDPTLPIAKVSRIEDLVSASIAQPRFTMALLIGLACCAALLAAVGVYGVVTYTVTRRTPEIGLRMALGAGAHDAFRLVVGDAARVVLVGVVLGLAGAAALGRAFDRLLFGVPPFDAVTFTASGIALMIVGLVAASVPAARAARIDPAGTLRS
ncbi:MAG TPA: ABC transporter permease [Vicinamibacterales bacterium]|nr:ABC transporter permease [Vicinamibacterales bacterium]